MTERQQQHQGRRFRHLESREGKCAESRTAGGEWRAEQRDWLEWDGVGVGEAEAGALLGAGVVGEQVDRE